ncbi:EEF1A lysine methyltransferase 1 [Neocloeon triangulifer]|uniref:EEF1A lysine methyltransferase 1 n=1 Tax=Neocloeon triangulifer TaxID=2078957 RepID=UPI00286F57F3|nr:EEF1A lysine methyltransferase 1 [Neocloeon triangulifer]
MSDDDEPQLSAATFAALQEFYNEEKERQDKVAKILESVNDNKQDIPQFQEDWQLSQFWYDDETADRLAKEVLKAAGPEGKIALVSCPTLYTRLKKSNANVTLFEYDERFAAYETDFCFYDYRNPLKVPSEMTSSFDIVVADPPFLSEECLTKTAVTIRYLAKDKILLCTGAVMSDLAQRLLQVRQLDFLPGHRNNLGNEFRCFANFECGL